MPDQDADEYVVSDPELITRVRTGDREAFGELYRRHSGPATVLSRQFARSPSESDDLVSESFARVLDNLLGGKGPDTAFRAYLFTTIRNTAYDKTRKDKRLQFTDDMTTHDVAVLGADPVLARMENGLVATAFAQLPERWQAVLWHTQVEGESPATVGAMLGMAPGAVSSLAFRAREGLREAYLQAHLAETAADRCRSTVERLGAWTRGGLSKREKAQVDAHLDECDRCRALGVELNEVNHGLRALLAPLLLGGAAAGYVATLGPVAPLAAPGALLAGGAGSVATAGGAAGGTSAAGTGAGAGAGAAAGTGAAGSVGSVGAGAGAGAGAAGAAGAAGGGTAVGAGAAGTAGAAAASGVAASAAGTTAAGAAAAAAAAGATTVGMTAVAHASGTGTAGGTGAGIAAGTGGAAGTGSVAGGAVGVGAGAGGAGATAAGATAVGAAGAGATAAGATAAGATAVGATAATGAGVAAVGGAVAAGGAAAVGGVAAAGGAAALGGVAAAGGAAALGGAAAVGGISGVLAGVSVGGLVAAGAAVVVAGVTAVALIANSPTNTTDTAAGTSESSITEAVGTTGGAPTGEFQLPTTLDGTVFIPGGDVPTNTPSETSQTDLGGLVPIAVPTPDVPTTADPIVPVLTTEPLVPEVPVPPVEIVPLTEAPLEPPAPPSTESEPAPPTDLPIVPPTDPPVAPTSDTPVEATTPDPTTPDPTTPDPTTPDPTTPEPPPPANLSVSDLTASPLAAGEVGSATVTITNTGGQPSDPQSLNLRPPDGVQVTSADFALQSPGLRRASAGLLRGSPVDCAAGLCTVGLPAVPNGGTVTVTLTISVPVTGTNGELVITVGGSDRSLTLAVPAAPADVRISGPNRAAATAGGGGGFVVTVRNVGGTAATAQDVRLTMPDGVSVTGIEAEGRPTCAAVTDCTLDSVNPGDSFRLTVRVAVAFNAVEVPDGVTVAVGGSSLSFALPIKQPITALTTANGPLVADGSRQRLSLDATTIADVSGAEITFTAAPDTVTLGGEGCSGDGRELTCALNGSSIPLTVLVPSGLPTGDLPVTARDSAERVIPIRGSGGAVRIVQPAKVEVSGLAVADPFVAGGNGRLTASVTNSGGVDARDQTLDIGLPGGVVVERVLAGGTQICGPGSCSLDVLPAGETVALQIVVRVSPTADPGTARLEVGGAGDALAVAIDGGVDALLGSSAGPLIADGEPRQVTFRQRTVSGEVDPGPLTLTAGGDVTFGAGGDCTPSGPQVITCDGRTFTVAVIVGPGQAAGQLPVTVADHYHNNVSLIGAADGDLTVQARPARLQFSEVDNTDPVPAGGSGTVRFSVRNTGGTAWPERDLAVVPSAGLTVASVAVAGSPPCTGSGNCPLPEIPPAGSLDVEIQFAVSPTAGPGPLTIAISAGGAERTVTIGVRSGVASVSAQYSAALIPGATTTVPVTVGPVDGVTDTGPITITAPDGGLSFEPTAGCSPAPAGAVCTGSSFDLAIAVPLDQPPGAIRLTAADAGGRSVDVTGPSGKPLQVAARRLVLSEIDVLQPNQRLTVLRIAVYNPASVASAEMPIDVTASTGVELLGVTTDGRDSCSPLLTACRLASVPAGGAATVDVLVSARRDVPQAGIEVTIDGSTRSVTCLVRSDHPPDAVSEGSATDPATTAEPLADAVLPTDLIEPAFPAPDGPPADEAPAGDTPADSVPDTTDPDTSVLAGSPDVATPTTPGNGQADVTSNEPSAPAEGAGTTDPSPADAAPADPAAADTTPATTGTTDTTAPAEARPTPTEAPLTEAPSTEAPSTETPSTDDPASTGGETTTTPPEPSATEPLATEPFATEGDVAVTVESPGPTPTADSPAEPTSTEPTNNEPTSAETTPAAEPAVADLVLSEPWVTQSLVPGRDSGEIRFTVFNAGAGPSPEQPLTAVLPTGVTVLDVHVDGTPGGQSASQLPPIAAGSAVTVVVTLAADRDAVGGPAALSLDGRDLFWTVPVEALPTLTRPTG